MFKKIEEYFVHDADILFELCLPLKMEWPRVVSADLLIDILEFLFLQTPQI